MSLGPSESDREEPKSVETIRKVQVFTSGVVRAFTSRPAYILFYLGVAGLLIGLYIGKTFDWHYYAILAFLGFIELVLWAERRRASVAK
jgi:hypothetical protein